MGPIVDIQIQRLQKLLDDRKISSTSPTPRGPGSAASDMTRSMAPPLESGAFRNICRTRCADEILAGEYPTVPRSG
jgi:hypothetical protein